MISMEYFDLLIQNGTILTMDKKMSRIEAGAVGIRSGRIVFVGKKSDLSAPLADQILDVSGGIILPGLVNSHTHLPMSLFRGLADDLPLETWLTEYIFPAERAYLNPETVRIGTLLSCSEMLLSGTTTCCDGYFFEDVVAEAVMETGMRGILGQGIINHPAPGVPDPKKNILTAEAFLKKWKDRHPAIFPSLFCHSVYTCSPETLKSAKALTRKYDALFQIHAAETRVEADFCRSTYQTTPVRFLNKMEILDSRTLLVHAIWVDDEEIAYIAEKKTTVAHTPESNMKLGSGIAPVAKLVSAGIPMGLGTDGCASNNDLDLFSEMDTTAKLQKVASLDPGILDAATVLRMATIDGAKAVGLEDFIGSIETGKAADIIVVDTKKPRLTPAYDPFSLLVYSACGADVRDVIVSGKLVVRDGRLQTLDLSGLLTETEKICEKIRKSFGKPIPPQTR